MSKWTDWRLDTDELAKKRIVAGFDGFVDTTVRPVRRASTNDGPAELFETIGEFGEYLVSKAGKSCSVELQVESRHLGGNMPFLSCGAAALGLNVTSIGMLGEGGNVEEPFRTMPCTLYPFTASGQSTCMEFKDGKVMLAPTHSLPEDPWMMVMKATNQEAPQLFETADLVALVNWSELSFSQQLWQSTYDQVLANSHCDKERFSFFDLCDISRKSKTEIEAVLKLIGTFSNRRTTVLSLNENEAQEIIARVLACDNDLLVAANILRTRYGIDQVLIHTIRQSMMVCDEGIFMQDTKFIENPKISTGAGDHFNAAFCFGTVMGLDAKARLQFANCYAGLYITSGNSPSLELTMQVLSEE